MRLIFRHLAQKWLGIYSDQCRGCKKWFFSRHKMAAYGHFVGFCSYFRVAHVRIPPAKVLGNFTAQSLLAPPTHILCGYGSSLDMNVYTIQRQEPWFSETNVGPCDKCIERMVDQGQLTLLGEYDFWGHFIKGLEQ